MNRRLAAMAAACLLALVGCASRGGEEQAATWVAPSSDPQPAVNTPPTTRPDTTEEDIAELRRSIPGLSYSDARYLVTVCFRLPDPDGDTCIDNFVRSRARSSPATTTRHSPPPTYTPRPTSVPSPSYDLPSSYSPTIPYAGNGGGPTQCRDGSISNSSGRGTCSHHGGVSR